ncbi:MAG: phytanoyl-CoA dioxygenase family protein [Gammaproteobacteria bacterium]|nr:phytanoyl-CoA dioxygenase family protein [Gammaproteobacteria bacterium]
MTELDDLRVCGETSVGWCELTQPNETTDDFGNLNPTNRGFGVKDPYAPSARRYDHPEIQELREYLKNHNGFTGLDICDPTDLDRIAHVFFRDGFVVVRDILSKKRLEEFREGSTRILREILSYPGTKGRKYITETGRLPHRYSYGTSSASRQLLHDAVWANMVDLPTTTPILTRLFGNADYSVIGAGGDLCLPGAIEYQHLHRDIQESFQLSPERIKQAKQVGVKLKGDCSNQLSLVEQRLVTDFTPPLITINFLMSDLTYENGPIRQIAGTHAATHAPPPPSQEPAWMRLSTLVGADAGAAMFRDNRGWHGATPNLSKEVRSLPDVEYGAPWWSSSHIAKTMPFEMWNNLSEHGKHICRFVKADPGTWPPGAGVMHPLAEGRRKAKEKVKSKPD